LIKQTHRPALKYRRGFGLQTKSIKFNHMITNLHVERNRVIMTRAQGYLELMLICKQYYREAERCKRMGVIAHEHYANQSRRMVALNNYLIARYNACITDLIHIQADAI
jgi:hypothetical protein